MPNFRYSARDKNGEARDGIAFAEDDRHLREMLRSTELFLTKFAQVDDTKAASRETRLFGPRRVRLVDMVEFSRQLATLVRAGIPIVESLGTVSFQTDNPILAEAVREVRIDVLAGSSLAGAMRQHPKIFNELYISLVDAGEVGGVLDQTLEVAADQFDKQAVLREQVKSAMTYPILVILASFGVIAFMLVFIVPTFAGVYAGFNKELPAITQLLVSMSYVATKLWWIVILATVGIVLGVRAYYHTDGGRLVIDRLLLKLPLVGKVLRKIAIARFAQTWSGATKGGIPILKALSVSANTAGNVVIKNAVMEVASNVEEGSPLGPPLDETGQFPPLVTRMIASGESSGNLDLMLEEVTKFYHRDVDYSVQKMTKLLEPIMTIVVGAIVLFVLLALYMPVFMLTQVIKR